MTHHAAARIVPEHAPQAASRRLGAVAHDDDAGVLRVAHADAAAMVNRHPGGAARGIQQRVQQGPIRDRIGAVAHRFGFPIRARHRARVQVIAADDDGRGQFAARDHLVEGEPQAMTLAEAHPADARRQALKMNARSRHVEPVMQMRIIRNQFLDLRVGLVDILGIAGQRGPAERTDAAAEQRADVLRHEARNIECMRHAGIARHLADVVAVVEYRQSHRLEAQQILDVFRHGALGRALVPSGSLTRRSSHCSTLHPCGR